MEELPISVLIPTMNRPDSLRRTLDAFLRGSAVPRQFVIVDQTQESVLRQRVRDVVAVCGKTTKVDYFFQEFPSSTLARNKAFSEATEEILIYCDDDVDVWPDTVQTVYELMQENQTAMIAGLNDRSRKSNSKIGYLLGEKTWSKRKIGHVTPSMLGRFPVDLRDQTPTQWAMGFFFVVRRSLAIRYGMHWDEKLVGYAYAEDLDYTLTYQEHAAADGYRCLFDARVHVSHMDTREYRTPSRKHLFSYHVNRWYLSYKHGYGISSRIAICWCDFWKLLHRIVTRNAPGTFLEGWWYAFRSRKQLKAGIVKYPF